MRAPCHFGPLLGKLELVTLILHSHVHRVLASQRSFQHARTPRFGSDSRIPNRTEVIDRTARDAG